MSRTIRHIQAEQTLDLRSRILRPGQPIEQCQYAEDHLITSFHLAIFDQHRIVCNGTFIQQGHTQFTEAKHPYRLRGMACDNAFQGQGLGSRLIREALILLQQKKCDLIWFNARVSAEKFYEKLGFQKKEEIFDIPTIGPHKVMYKWL